MNKLLLSLLVSFSLNQTFAQSASPTLQDAQNLAEVMSGAREKINPEIPKDKYGRPAYHIGNLGGVPVHLPQGVDYLEYSDSPGWDPEAIKNYNPDVRTYNSVIESFGFEFRNKDLAIYDRRDNQLYKERNFDYDYFNGDGWVDVSISSGKSYGNVKEALTATFNSRTDGTYLQPPYPVYIWHYERLEKEDKYGLETYANPGVNPKSNRPWREDMHANDLFIVKDENNLVKTYIECSTLSVRYPPCSHDIRFPDHMKIRLRINYSRKNLKHWQEYENNAIKIINSFKIN